MNKRKKELLTVALQGYIQTPVGKEFMKNMEEYNKKLDEMTSILGVSPKSRGKKKDEFNKAYSYFILTDEGRQYHEYFLAFDKELQELEERLVPGL